MQNLTHFLKQQRSRFSSFELQGKLRPGFLVILAIVTVGSALLALNVLLAWNPPASAPPTGNVVTNWAASGSNIYNANVGNVGVGATGPGQKLSVAGTFGILEGGVSPSFYTIFQGGDQSANTTYTLPIAYPSVAGQVLSSNLTGTLSWVTAGGGAQTPWTSNINAAGFALQGNSIASGNLTLDSTSDVTKGFVLLNPTGGNVGIGTTVPPGPLGLLHIKGAAGAQGNIIVDHPSPTGLVGIALSQNSARRWLTYVPTSSTDLRFFDSADRVTFETGGNVGIGTTDPGYRLDAVGGFSHFGVNSQAIPPSDGTNGGLIVGWNRNAGSAEVNLYNAFNNAPTSFIFSQKTGAGTFADLMTIRGNGNVGIGTTDPLAELHISSNSTPSILLGNPLEPGGEKNWTIENWGANLMFMAKDDAGTGGWTWLQVNRTGFSLPNYVMINPPIRLTERLSNPPVDPTAGDQAQIYMKADKLVVQYNDAGIVRYKYLLLSGTGATWVHTTIAP